MKFLFDQYRGRVDTRWVWNTETMGGDLDENENLGESLQNPDDDSEEILEQTSIAYNEVEKDATEYLGANAKEDLPEGTDEVGESSEVSESTPDG